MLFAQARFYYNLPQDSGGVLLLHVGCLSIQLSIHTFFQDDNLSKYQWIFTTLGKCIDIVELWFWIADEQISLIFDSYLLATLLYFGFQKII